MTYHGKSIRHELKYIINYHEYHDLRLRLSAALSLDEHSGADGYHIRSLYFDDVYHSALAEKEAGVFLRKKYRVRIYDFNDNSIKLERKEKYGNFISKQSVSISKEQFYSMIQGGRREFLMNLGSEMARQMYCEMNINLLKPAVIVDYRREAYVLHEGNVRITFDKNLQAGLQTYDIFSDSVILANPLEPGYMILEIKYDDYLPGYVNKLLQIRSQYRAAISKYVLCRELQMLRNPVSAFRISPLLSQYADTKEKQSTL